MLLEVANLAIDLTGPAGAGRIVYGSTFALDEGESLGVVGESGSGKTMTALALMGLTPENARVSGSIRFEGQELVGLGEEAMLALRGDRIAMIFQEPMTALNPLHRVGAQVAEPLVLHRGMTRETAFDRAVQLLDHVRLADPERAAQAYPFALSGGERQRAMIAMAIGCGPRLVIADEPTTALDVTVQARILALIDGLRSESGMALILVSHDLAVVAGHCDRVIVLYAGVIMESGPVEAVLQGAEESIYARASRGAASARSAARAAAEDHPRLAARPPRNRRRLPVRRPLRVRHRHLPHDPSAGGPVRRRSPFALPPRPGDGTDGMSEPPLLEVVDLVKTYRLPRKNPFSPHGRRPALAGVSFSIVVGHSFGIVGESGSGKSTLARIALALDRPDSGAVRLEGRSLFELAHRELRGLRAHMQMIFQDPYGSLDPRQRVERIVAEPLAALGGAGRAERNARVAASLEAVGLRPADALKYPHEFSGGQRQRIAIARALITRPKLVIADEPVSALDVSVQAQALNLMSDLQQQAGVTFLLISHDLAVVAHICDTTAVMYRGRIVEIGPTEELFRAPAHPYTRELVDATPRFDRPTQAAPAAEGQNRFESLGCPYAARCAFAQPRCQEEAPELKDLEGQGRRVACWFPLA